MCGAYEIIKSNLGHNGLYIMSHLILKQEEKTFTERDRTMDRQFQSMQPLRKNGKKKKTHLALYNRTKLKYSLPA